jgi:hypothetical protein
VWFFVIADCEKNTFKYLGDTDHHPVTVRLDLQNAGSYFSEEETGLLPMMGLLFIAIIAMIGINGYYWKQDFDEFNRLDHPLILITLTLFQLLSKCMLKMLALVLLYLTGKSFTIIKAFTIFTSLMS